MAAAAAAEGKKNREKRASDFLLSLRSSLSLSPFVPLLISVCYTFCTQSSATSTSAALWLSPAETCSALQRLRKRRRRGEEEEEEAVSFPPSFSSSRSLPPPLFPPPSSSSSTSSDTAKGRGLSRSSPVPSCPPPVLVPVGSRGPSEPCDPPQPQEKSEGGGGEGEEEEEEDELRWLPPNAASAETSLQARLCFHPAETDLTTFPSRASTRQGLSTAVGGGGGGRAEDAEEG